MLVALVLGALGGLSLSCDGAEGSSPCESDGDCGWRAPFCNTAVGSCQSECIEDTRLGNGAVCDDGELIDCTDLPGDQVPCDPCNCNAFHKYCDEASGFCRPQKEDGEACSTASDVGECESGQCFEGMCAAANLGDCDGIPCPGGACMTGDNGLKYCTYPGCPNSCTSERDSYQWRCISIDESLPGGWVTEEFCLPLDSSCSAEGQACERISNGRCRFYDGFQSYDGWACFPAWAFPLEP